MTITRRLEPPRAINEKLSVFDVVLPFEFREKSLRDRVRSPLIETNTEDEACFGIYDGVQPELFVIE